MQTPTKQLTVYTPPNGHIFHYREDCGKSKKKIAKTIEEAKSDGYEECKTCKNKSDVVWTKLKTKSARDVANEKLKIESGFIKKRKRVEASSYKKAKLRKKEQIDTTPIDPNTKVYHGATKGLFHFRANCYDRGVERQETLYKDLDLKNYNQCDRCKNVSDAEWINIKQHHKQIVESKTRSSRKKSASQISVRDDIDNVVWVYVPNSGKTYHRIEKCCGTGVMKKVNLATVDTTKRKQCQKCKNPRKTEDEKKQRRSAYWKKPENKQRKNRMRMDLYNQRKHDQEFMEKLRVYTRRYDNSEKGRLTRQMYRNKNPEKALARSRKYREKVETWLKYKHERTTPEYMFKETKRRAEKRGILFNMTLDDMEKLVESSCVYCGEFSDMTVCGPDRVDPRGDYEPENVMPACSACNYMKYIYELPDFIQLCCNIAKNHGMELPVDICYYTIGDYRYKASVGFQKYKQQAILRGLIFDIENDKFTQISQDHCYYCGKQGTPDCPIGVDRVNSDIGYINNNCVPCCCYCNFSKSDMEKDEFIKKSFMIAKNWHTMLLEK